MSSESKTEFKAIEAPPTKSATSRHPSAAPSHAYTESSNTTQMPERNTARTISGRSRKTDLSEVSGTNSRAEILLDDIVVCPICQETMVTPKLMPCLHSACKKCLQRHINSYAVSTEHPDMITSFPCPVCKLKTSPRDTLYGFEKWSGQFPTNYFLHTYALVLNVQNRQVNCDPCFRRGEFTHAGWWCSDCGEYQCHVCNTVHCGFKVFKHHSVMPIEGLTDNPETAIKKYEECEEHKEKRRLFCRDHSQSCCEICASSNHKECRPVVTLTDEFHVLEKKGMFANLVKQLREFEDTANEMLDHRHKLVDDLEARKQEIIHQIKHIRNEFEARLQQLEDKMLGDFSNFHKDHVAKLKDITDNCENLNRQISNAAKLFDAVQQNGSEPHVVEFHNKIASRCEKYEEEIKDYQSKVQNIDYEFRPDRALENMVATTLSIGNVRLKRDWAQPDKLPTPIPIKRNIAKEIAKLRVWIAGDRGRCGILGGVYLDDNRILVADFDNFKIKLFNENGRILSQCKLKNKPSDMTKIDATTFAVTYPSTGNVQFIHLTGNTVSDGQLLGMPRMYHSVSYDGGKLFLLCSTGVATCDRTGTEQCFWIPVDKGKAVFKSPGFIRATGRRLLVTDCEKNCVTCLTVDGRLISTHSANGIIYPVGMDVDSLGNIYVCCRNSSTVQQLSADGRPLKVLLSEKDGVDQPMVIRFQEHGSRFFVYQSGHPDDKDFIRVFELT